MNESTTHLVDAVILLIRSLAQDGDLPRDLTVATLSGETRLEELGLDSLGELNLISAIDERFRVFIPDDAISPEMKISALADKIASRQR